MATALTPTTIPVTTLAMRRARRNASFGGRLECDGGHQDGADNDVQPVSVYSGDNQKILYQGDECHTDQRTPNPAASGAFQDVNGKNSFHQFGQG
jgi:hypothetical protein